MTAYFVQLLDELQRRSLRMATLVEDIVQEACEAAFGTNERLARRVIVRDDEVDAEEVEIEAETVRLMALYQPVGSDLRLLCTILKVNNDLERVADCAVNIAERAVHLAPESTAGFGEEIERITSIVKHMLRNAVQAYGSNDADHARKVFLEEDAVDALYGQIIRKTVEQATHHTDRIASLLDVLSIAKNLERIADHATNIAEDVVFLSTGRIVRHNLGAKE